MYDRQGDAHYDVISAFIKSIRGSDPDAALFWLARMLEAGEDAAVHRPAADRARERGHRARRPAGAARGRGGRARGRARRPPRGPAEPRRTPPSTSPAPRSRTASTRRSARRSRTRPRAEPVPLHLRDATLPRCPRPRPREGLQVPARLARPPRRAGVPPDAGSRDHAYYEPCGMGDDVPEPGTGTPVAGTPSRPRARTGKLRAVTPDPTSTTSEAPI